MSTPRYLEIKTRMIICFLSLFTFISLLFFGFFLFDFDLAWILIVFIAFTVLMGLQLFLKFFFKQTKRCPQCDSSVSIYSEYCSNCGFQLLKKCHNCGNIMRYNEEICRKCRTKSRLFIIPDNAKVELKYFQSDEDKRKKNDNH